MSPILVRPIREQLEHDRVIRLLQAKYKRKFDVAINPGHERLQAVGTGANAEYPDLVLSSTQPGRRLMGVVEIETGESVNQLEAMSQWARFGRMRAAFYLYVPTASVDPARRMCADLGIGVAELWAYHALGDQIRFTLVERDAKAAAKSFAAPAVRRAAKTSVRPSGASRAPRTAKKTVKAGAGKTTVKRAVKKSTRKAAAGKKRVSAASKKR